MRKINPTDLCADLQSELDNLEDFYEASLAALELTPNGAKRISTLSEVVFHRGYVAMESFFSAYFVGCVNRDASRFLQFRRNQIEQSVAAKYSDWDKSHLDYSPPRHPPVAVVSLLLDAGEQNLVFGDFQTMLQRAQLWLAPEWHAKVAAIPEDRRAIMDAAKAVRNCIAHQSQISFRRMNDALLTLPAQGTANLLRREVRAVNSVGAYLKARPVDWPRTTIYFGEFRHVAEALQ